MAYEPKTWQRGEVVTADDLNRIERGIAEAGGASLIVTGTVRQATTEECPNGGTTTTYSHSWQEIYDALASGIPVYDLYVQDESTVFFSPITSCYYDDSEGEYIADTTSGTLQFPDTTSKKHVRCD